MSKMEFLDSLEAEKFANNEGFLLPLYAYFKGVCHRQYVHKFKNVYVWSRWGVSISQNILNFKKFIGNVSLHFFLVIASLE